MSLSIARRRLLAVLAVVAAPLLTLTAPQPAQASIPAVPSGWTTTFSDDFTGASGSGINTGDWLYDIGTGYPGGASGWGTGEVETMTSSTANVYQDGQSHLVIRPIRDGSGHWTSGRVETRRTDFAAPAGGKMRMEASIQQPNVSGAGAAGYWPAFWALGAAARPAGATNWPGIGELDIMEDINGRSSEFATLHCGVGSGGPCNETTGLGSGERACGGCQTGFHQYAVEYDRSVAPEQLRYYLDGNNFFTINAEQVDATTWSNAVQHGFFMILNVAIGGGFPAAFGGGPTGATQSGVPMLVDYVRVLTSSGASSGNRVISNFNGKCLDVPGFNYTDGQQADMWDCNNGSNQNWDFTGGTVRTQNNKCLDVTGNGTANGTPIEIWTCNGGANQQFVLNAAGDLVNPQANKCVDIPGFTNTNGATLDLWDCNGGSNQKWHRG